MENFAKPRWFFGLDLADSESPPPSFTASAVSGAAGPIGGASTPQLRRAESMRIQQQPPPMPSGMGGAVIGAGASRAPKLGRLPTSKSFEASMIANMLEGIGNQILFS